MQINDCIRYALGDEGQINDLLIKFYQGAGAVSGQINDAEYEYLVIQGATPAALNDMWFQVLRTAGFLGSLNDMLFQFWCDAAPVAPSYFEFNSDGYIDCPITFDWGVPHRLEYIISPLDNGVTNRDMWSTLDNSCIGRFRGTYDWRSVRGGAGSNINAVVVTVGELYQIVEDAADVENIGISRTDINTSVEQTGVAGPVGLGANLTGFRIGGNLGTSLYAGRISDFKIFNDVGTLIHHWPIDEGVGINIQDIVGGADGTLTPGTGSWVTP